MIKFSIGKKSQASLLVWFVAFLAIVFIMAVFLIISISMLGERKISGSNKVQILRNDNNLILIEEFLNFLDKEIEFDNKRIIVKELVNSEEGLKVFKELSEKFIDDIAEETNGAWVRVYDKDDIIKKVHEERMEYKKYWSEFGTCDKIDFYIYENDKKIAFCIE